MKGIYFLENKLKSLLEQQNTVEVRKILEVIHKAKEIENKETLKRQLFIGKVSEIIGVEKTIELLKEVNNKIK